MYSHLAGDLDGDQRIQDLPQYQKKEPQWLKRADVMSETPDPAKHGRRETGWNAVDKVSVRLTDNFNIHRDFFAMSHALKGSSSGRTGRSLTLFIRHFAPQRG